MTHSIDLLRDIGLSIVFATLASHAARLLKQPLILGYVAGGILLGPAMGMGWIHEAESIELISEIGLIFLLFIIGLEINLPELLKMGRSMLALGVLQFAVCSLLGFFAFRAFFGDFFNGRFDYLYLAVTSALSSTLIVVKLLHDKFEMHTTAGRLTLGVLIFQDIWAIIFMAFQPNFSNPQAAPLLKAFGLGAVLIAGAFVASRFLLSKIFKSASKNPELVLLSSIAWCFFVSFMAQKTGLSKEMGALIAGLSIAAFPYGHDVISKLSGIRDFFVTLFFVSLGLKMPLPTVELLGAAAIVMGVVLAGRLIAVAPTVHFSGKGYRMGFVTALNLSQISEFSLVIAALGTSYGHISGRLETTLLTAMLLMSVLSTYLIYWNNPIASLLVRALPFCRSSKSETGEQHSPHVKPRIFVLGAFRDGLAFLETLGHLSPEMKREVVVVDFNAALKPVLAEKGFRWEYGDLSHPETLHHLGIDEAEWILCTLSNTFLKGTTTFRLLAQLKSVAPEAKILMVADDEKDRQKLIAEGAADVAVSSHLVGHRLFELLQN